MEKDEFIMKLVELSQNHLKEGSSIKQQLKHSIELSQEKASLH